MRRRHFLLSGLGLTLSPALPALAQTQSFLGLSQAEASAGVREALTFAAQRATGRLGLVNGFFGDPRVRIPLPGALGSSQRALANLGLSAPLDDLQLRMNRAAESVMPQASNLFVSVIRNLTIADAVTILRGGDTGATAFLRTRTDPRLTTLLTPPVRTQLNQAGAFTALNAAARSIGMGDASRSLRDQLVSFTVTRALDGVFAYLGEEERAIRRDPVRRTSDILRRVFGR